MQHNDQEAIPKIKQTMNGFTATFHCECGTSEVVDNKKHKTIFGKISTISPPFVCSNCNKTYSQYYVEYKRNQLKKNRLIAIGLGIAIVIGFIAFNFNDWKQNYQQQKELEEQMQKKNEIDNYLKNQ